MHQEYFISTLHQVIRMLCNPICVFNYHAQKFILKAFIACTVHDYCFIVLLLHKKLCRTVLTAMF